MGPGLKEIHSALRTQGIEASGPWLTHHLRMDPEVFDFEICVPTASGVVPSGRVESGTWPAMTVIRTSYTGPFEGLPEAWGQFDAWIASEGLTVGQDLWEQYISGPESGPDPAGWRTEFSRQKI